MWHDIFANDKIMVIIAVTIIAVTALLVLADASAKEICLTSLGALGGLVAGQIFKRESVDKKEE
jgi:type IV secretory pathway VirB3-like protein